MTSRTQTGDRQAPTPSVCSAVDGGAAVRDTEYDGKDRAVTGATPDDEDVTIPTFMYHGMHVLDLRQAKEAGIYDEATPDFRERGPRGRAWFPARGGMEPTPGYDDIAAHADAAADATDLRQARRADD